MREIKFDLIYKGKTGFHHKKYHLCELMRGIRKICDIHDIMELVAERQYTGLKDKNGVEIYEGDLLAVRHKRGDYLIKEKPANLYFSDGAFQLELSSESREMFLFEVCSSNASTAISHTCEVIGNIYENPELLK